jgi:hypothetical protein
MNTMTAALGVLTAFLALATAYLAYRQKRMEMPKDSPAGRRSKSSVSVLEVNYGARKPPLWIIVLKWVSIPTGLLSLLLTVQGIHVLLWKNIPVGAVNAIFFGLCTVALGWAFVVLSRDPLRWVSKTRSSAHVKVKGKYEDVFNRCQTSVRTLGAHIDDLDFAAGRIGAHTGWTWRSSGEKIVISIQSVGTKECSIELSSDSILPTTIVDLGKNRGNVQRLIEHL